MYPVPQQQPSSAQYFEQPPPRHHEEPPAHAMPEGQYAQHQGLQQHSQPYPPPGQYSYAHQAVAFAAQPTTMASPPPVVPPPPQAAAESPVIPAAAPLLGAAQRQAAQDERVRMFWGRNYEAVRSAAELEPQLAAALSSPAEALQLLSRWAWAGNAEAVLETLGRRSTSGGGDLGEALMVLRAALLLKLGRSKDATEVVEALQKSRLVAAKVLCAVLAFGWNERATAVDMLYKVMAGLSAVRASEEEDASRSESSRSGSGSQLPPQHQHQPQQHQPQQQQPLPHGQQPQQQAGLLDLLGRPLDAPAAARWRLRVAALLVAGYASAGDFGLAVDLCRSSLASAPASARAATHLQLARLHMQIGDTEAARAALGDAHAASQLSPPEGREADRLACLLAEGLLLFAESQYARAAEAFEAARAQVQAKPARAPLTLEDAQDGLLDLAGDTEVTLANNLALCYLHGCELSRAIATLEDCVRANPARNMHKAVVFNLCTLYDLAKPKDLSRQAKDDLRRLADIVGIAGRFDIANDFRL
jgi:hypothetical protein